MNQPNPHQAIYNIAALCAAHGLTEVVLSPGSRCAPLTLAFSRHPQTNVRVVPDERAAAFIGLGIAQARRVPTVLVCTSGTAGLNYAPAVAEAFYQQVPLLILTADRPPEWIDQLDGQTIRQNGLYGPHVKGSYTFPTDTTHPDAKWHANRLMNEAINLAKAYPPGPVHVNIPLREPLYPSGEVEFEEVRVIEPYIPPASIDVAQLHSIKQDLIASERILIVLGQQPYDEALLTGIMEFSQARIATVVADCIGQMNAPDVIHYHDVFLAHSDFEALRPDILITTGLSVVSKALKQFLRKAQPKRHIHVAPTGPVADPFQTLTDIVYAKPAIFFGKLFQNGESYFRPDLELMDANWLKAENFAFETIEAFFSQNATENLSEFTAIYRIIRLLPENVSLQLANSMAVRYANIFGWGIFKRSAQVFANRGTSGIDGCTSTAVGYALAEPEKQVVLLTGDVAFFYDRNAFWHNYPTPNLRVVLLNNHGGGIFRIIDGPRQQPELDEFFETRQQLTAENLCRDFHLPYFPVDSMAKLEAALPVFFGPEGAGGVLEIQTDSKVNAAFFEQYRAAVKQAFT